MSNVLTQLMGSVSNYQSVAGLFNSSLAVDVVRITTAEGKQLFTLARAIKAGVNPESELFEHPLETGNKIIDFKIDKPIVVQLGVLIPTESYESIYNEILQAKTLGTELVVQTRASTYSNLIIQAMPHEESPDYGDTLAMSITLREVQWFNPNPESLPAKQVSANPKTGAKSDADTLKQGQQRPTDASQGTQKKAESILHGWYS
ncbi:tail fiber protein [Yersinia phage vB_YenM_P744]